MKFQVVGKRLIYINEGYNLIKGENNNELITIEMPRYPYGTDIDYLSLSHRLTITSMNDSKIAVCVIPTKAEMPNNKINLSYPVTNEITSVGEKVFFKITSVGANDFIDITECSMPIEINGNTDEDRYPSEIDAQQLLSALQLAVQDAKEIALNAKGIADKALKASTEAKNEALKASTAAQKADNSAICAEKNAQDAEKSAQDAANTVSELNSNAEEALVNQANIKIAINDIKSYIGYTDSDIIGLHADFENNIFTRLGVASGLSGGADFDKFPMYGGRRRCNVLDDGTITAYYGDNNFIEDGSNGQVMVYQPKFYYKVVPLKLDPITDGCGYHLRNANYFISAVPKNGFKLHPAFYDESGNPLDYILFSAYEGSIFDTSENIYLQADEQIADFATDKLSSIVGVKPCSGKTQVLIRVNAELLAKNRGAGWHIETIKTVSINQLLMAIEYGAFNMQSKIGLGISFITDDGTDNFAVTTGKTSSFGNSTGAVNSMSPTDSVSYRGMENIWGNIWTFANGLNLCGNGTQRGGIPYISTDLDFAENKVTDNYKSAGFTYANPVGYISSFGYSEEKYDWLFIASEALGNNDLPIGDSAGGFSNFGGLGTAAFGGYCSNGYVNGPFYSILGWNSAEHLRFLGARLVYIPTSNITHC